MSLIVFPAIDLKGGQVVRLAEGDMARATVYGDDPAAQAMLFADAGAAHLHVVDLDGAFAGDSVNGAAVKAIVERFPGHVQLGDHVTVGGLTGILQRMRIGDHAMIGFASHVNKDVPPFLVVDGNPLQVRGVNLVGLRRRDFSAERQTAVREMHKLLYRQGKTLDEAIAGIEALTAAHPEAAGEVAAMLGFLRSSTVGIAR